MSQADKDEIMRLLDEAKAELEAIRIDEDLCDRDLELARLRKALELITMAVGLHVKP